MALFHQRAETLPSSVQQHHMLQNEDTMHFGSGNGSRSAASNAQAAAPPPQAWGILYPSDGSPPLKMYARTVIGRDPARCDVVVDDARISGVHCVLDVRRGVPGVLDNSTNGTFICGRRLPSPSVNNERRHGHQLVKIKAGDVIQLVAVQGLQSYVKEFHFHPLFNVVPEAFEARHSERGHHNPNFNPVAEASAAGAFHHLPNSGGDAVHRRGRVAASSAAASPIAPLTAPKWEEPRERVIIGRGATSQVFLAIDSRTGQFLAVKEIVKPLSWMGRSALQPAPSGSSRARRQQQQQQQQEQQIQRIDAHFGRPGAGGGLSSTGNLTALPSSAFPVSASAADFNNNNGGALNNMNRSRGPPTSKQQRATAGSDAAAKRALAGPSSDESDEDDSDDDFLGSHFVSGSDDDDSGDGSDNSDDGLGMVATQSGAPLGGASGTLQGGARRPHGRSSRRRGSGGNKRSRRSLAELNMLQRLSHDRIVKFRGAEETEDVIRLFFEYISGGSMKDLLAKFGELSDNVVRLYTLHILHGMQYLHSQGVIHGDLKPANVCVTDSGVVKITDFGASLLNEAGGVDGDGSSDDDDGSGGENARLSSPRSHKNGGGGGGSSRRHPAARGGNLIGSPCYMSPEMCRGQRPSFASDVWALGCTVLEMATGLPPWSECRFMESVAAVFHIGRSNKPPSMARLMGRSPQLLDFVSRCFEIRPAARPTIRDLLAHPFIAGDGSPSSLSNSNQPMQLQPQQPFTGSNRGPGGNSNSGGGAGMGLGAAGRAFSFLDEEQTSPEHLHSNLHVHNGFNSSNSLLSNQSSSQRPPSSTVAAVSNAVMQDLAAHRNFLGARKLSGESASPNAPGRVNSDGGDNNRAFPSRANAIVLSAMEGAGARRGRNNNGANSFDHSFGDDIQPPAHLTRGMSVTGLTTAFEGINLAMSQQSFTFN